MEWNQGRETGPGLPSVWLATRASASSCDPRALTPMSVRQHPASKLQLLDLRLEALFDSHSLHRVIYGILHGYTTRTDDHLDTALSVVTTNEAYVAILFFFSLTFTDSHHAFSETHVCHSARNAD